MSIVKNKNRSLIILAIILVAGTLFIGTYKNRLYQIEEVIMPKVIAMKASSEWSDETIEYAGVKMEPQDTDNFIYGYLGRAAGFSEFELTMFAGIYKLTKGHSKLKYCIISKCDDLRSTHYIRMGIIKYDETR